MNAQPPAGPPAVLIAVGLAFLVLGLLMAARPGVARWGLTHGRGRVWVEILGMERAMRVTRFFFGPAVAVIGIFALVAGLFT